MHGIGTGGGFGMPLCLRDIPRHRGAPFLPASDGLVDYLQNGQTKSTCLAAASLCSCQYIPTSKNQRNAFILDGSR